MDIAAAPRGRISRARTVAMRGAIGLALGTVLVVTFLKLVNVSSVYQRLTHLDLGIAAACGVTFLAAYVVRAFRWRTLLRPNRVERPPSHWHLSGRHLPQLAAAGARRGDRDEPAAAAHDWHPGQRVAAGGGHGQGA